MEMKTCAEAVVLDQAENSSLLGLKLERASIRMRWNNLWGGLAVSMTAGPSGQAISPHPSSREGHHSTVRWISGFSPTWFDPAQISSYCDFPSPPERGVVNPDAVHDHGQATRQRCRPASSRLRHITEVFLETALTDN